MCSWFIPSFLFFSFVARRTFFLLGRFLILPHGFAAMTQRMSETKPYKLHRLYNQECHQNVLLPLLLWILFCHISFAKTEAHPWFQEPIDHDHIFQVCCLASVTSDSSNTIELSILKYQNLLKKVYAWEYFAISSGLFLCLLCSAPTLFSDKQCSTDGSIFL